MRRLSFNRDHISQLLLQPGFYAACPAFAYLQDAAISAEEARQAAGKLCCGREWPFYRGIVDAFFMKVRQLATEKNQEELNKVKDYVATKKGYRPDLIVLYYRRSRSQGKIAKLAF